MFKTGRYSKKWGDDPELAHVRPHDTDETAAKCVVCFPWTGTYLCAHKGHLKSHVLTEGHQLNLKRQQEVNPNPIIPLIDNNINTDIEDFNENEGDAAEDDTEVLEDNDANEEDKRDIIKLAKEVQLLKQKQTQSTFTMYIFCFLMGMAMMFNKQ